VLRFSLFLNIIILVGLLVITTVINTLIIFKGIQYFNITIISSILLVSYYVNKNYKGLNQKVAINFTFSEDLNKNLNIFNANMHLFKVNEYKILLKPSSKIEAEVFSDKTILVSTVLNELTERESLAVILHEIAHDKLGHVKLNSRNQLILFIINFLFTLAALSYAILVFIEESGVPAEVTVSFTLLSILYFSGIFIFLKGLRVSELEADAFVKKLGYGRELLTILNKINSNDMEITVLSTHPKIKTRISNLIK
jgi:Zn-dependent protease with chaperone function